MRHFNRSTKFFVKLICLMNLNTYSFATDNNDQREHISEINAQQVFYKIEFNVDKQCHYAIKNREVLETLWSEGLKFLEKFGKTVGDDPSFLNQTALSANENKEIRTLGKDSTDFYFKMEELLSKRHLGQDLSLDQILENIEKSKGNKNLDEIKNLDAEGILALKLARERFLLTANQIQEKLVYYDLLDEKVELVIDKMITAKNSSTDVAPYNVQFMAVTEMHLDNFRHILHDSKNLSSFLSDCYNKLGEELAKDISSSKIASLKVTMTGSSKEKLASNNSYRFIKLDNTEFNSIMNPNSEKYLEKLNSNNTKLSAKDLARQSMRRNIALGADLSKNTRGLMATRSGMHKAQEVPPLKVEVENEKENTNTDSKMINVEQASSKKIIEDANINAKSNGQIDIKSLTDELKSANHNNKIVTTSHETYQLNDEQMLAYRRAKREYRPTQDDSIFKILSKAYHRVAFPLFLTPKN